MNHRIMKASDLAARLLLGIGVALSTLAWPANQFLLAAEPQTQVTILLHHLVAVCGVSYAVTLVLLISHLWRQRCLTSEHKGLWTFLLLAFGFVLMPVYWCVFVWPLSQASDAPPTRTTGPRRP